MQFLIYIFFFLILTTESDRCVHFVLSTFDFRCLTACWMVMWNRIPPSSKMLQAAPITTTTWHVRYFETLAELKAAWAKIAIELTITSVCTTGTRRPGVLLPICDSASGATCHPCREPYFPRWFRGGEAPSAGCHEDHQTMAGGADGQL